LNSANIGEKRWQWQEIIGLRVPELTVDGGVELRVESPAVKRRLYMCCNSVIFGGL
jgi:hypothetical protein